MASRCRKSPQKQRTAFKDWPQVFRQLEGLPGVSLEERALLAQGIAATPDERLQIHNQYLRSLGLYSHWDRKKSGFKL